MFGIGFHRETSAFYEGEIGYGRAITPSPTVSVATLIDGRDDVNKIPELNTLATQFVFREDSFDPVTRIRRGRIYKWADGFAQPHRWHVQPYPGIWEEAVAVQGYSRIHKDLFSWAAWPAFQYLGPRSTTRIALGARGAYTLWRAVDVERTVTAEDLVTLKALHSLGTLPILDEAAIPVDGREKVVRLVEKLGNAAYTASEPEAVVDLARAVTQWCIGAWLASRRGVPELKGRDLGHLVSLLETREKEIAMLIARFHSRAKPNEQHKYSARPISDEDAEFALASVALLLRELGWVRG